LRIAGIFKMFNVRTTTQVISSNFNDFLKNRTGGKKDKPDGPEGTSIDEGPRYNGQYIEVSSYILRTIDSLSKIKLFSF
jgi:hypothetical protein